MLETHTVSLETPFVSLDTQYVSSTVFFEETQIRIRSPPLMRDASCRRHLDRGSLERRARLSGVSLALRSREPFGGAWVSPTEETPVTHTSTAEGEIAKQGRARNGRVVA